MAVTVPPHLDLNEEIELSWQCAGDRILPSSAALTPCVIPGTIKDSLRVAELLSASRAWLSSACQGPETELGGLHSVPSDWEPGRALTARKVNHRVWLRPWPAGGKSLSFSSPVRAQLESLLGASYQQRCWEAGKAQSKGSKMIQGTYKKQLRSLGLFGVVRGKLEDGLTPKLLPAGPDDKQQEPMATHCSLGGLGWTSGSSCSPGAALGPWGFLHLRGVRDTWLSSWSDLVLLIFLLWVEGWARWPPEVPSSVFQWVACQIIETF